ncbi:MAG: metallo-mystery pair system four-Cys motif protein [Polyangiales bacterium]
MKRLLSSAVFALFACAGCGDDSGSSDVSVSIPFAAAVGSQAAACGTNYGLAGYTLQLADARFFASNVQFKNTDGEWVTLSLDQNASQYQNVALLDFEDGTGACADSGTTETNTTITGVLPAGNYSGLRFDVGVPFELNHIDTASANSPLNISTMYWSWRGGYKHLKVDWAVEEGAVPRWNVHLGSTGCVSDSPTTPPSETCSRPNIAHVEISDFNANSDTVLVNLVALINNVDLGSNVVTIPDGCADASCEEPSPPGCQSSPTESADCSPVFDSLGMQFSDGLCVDDCAAQTVFSK